MIARHILPLAAASVLVAPWTLAPAEAKSLAPRPERVTLPNGLPVLVVERHDLPIVSVDLVLRAGGVNEAANEHGLASLTANLLTKGTPTRTAQAIADEIDALGASLGAGADPDKSEVELNVLKSDLDHGLALMGDVVSHPTFPAAELDKAKNLESAGLRTALDDPGTVTGLAASQGLFDHTAYGRPLSGGLAALATLQQVDVQRFYQANYRPDRGFMVVVGDITPAEVRQHFAKPFADWKAPATMPGLTVEHPQPTGWKGARLVPMDLTQANIKVAYPAIARNHPDYFPLVVATQILGGGYLSRLYKNVREEQGLAYSVGASNVLRQSAGTTVIGLQTKEEAAAQALKSVIAQVDDLRNRPVPAPELAAIKRFFLGKFPRDLEANSDLASMVSAVTFYGLPEDYFDRFVSRIQAVTAQDVQRVARKYFDPAHRQVTIVGHQNVLAKVAAPYGPVVVVNKTDLI
ncbi:MAG TPA: pitrilysin family protein, partial [Stenomitos sp.]